MSLQQMCFGTAENLHLLIWLLKQNGCWLVCAHRGMDAKKRKRCEISSSVVKETKSRKGKGLSLWLQPKNRIQANLALWLEAGRARESGRQIIWSSNPGLSTNFLCPCYPEEQNDTSMGELQGREEGTQEEEGWRDGLRGCKNEGSRRGGR